MRADWQLDQLQAVLKTPNLSARVDLTNPAAGLFDLVLSDVALPSVELLGLGLPPLAHAQRSQVDAYVRGTDLIATFNQPGEQPFRWEVYWRVQSQRYPNALAAIELVASVQTSLLDSQPELATCSVIAASHGYRCHTTTHQDNRKHFDCPPRSPLSFVPTQGLGCFWFEGMPAEITYVEMIHPSDFQSSSIEPKLNEAPANRTVLTHRLFTERLEKGVILRSRVLGLFLPRGTAETSIDRIYRDFVKEELPLTA